MTKLITKIVLFLIGIVILMGIIYIAMNASYFTKQVKYKFDPPKTNTEVNSSTNEKSEANHLSIPSISVEAPIVDPAGNKETDFQEALKVGVVRYPGSAKVGEVGNAYIFGHSSDFAFKGGTFKTVFALLPSIKNGAEVYITNNNGDKFTYVVTSQKVVKPDDTSVLDQNTNGKKILTLQTSYPVGTALKRYIVITELKE